MIGLSWLTSAAAVLFAAAWWRYRRPAIGAATVLFGLHASYEYLIAIRYLCSGDCNIRVDLLLIVPILLIAAIGAIWSAVAAGRRQ